MSEGKDEMSEEKMSDVRRGVVNSVAVVLLTMRELANESM